MKDDTLKYSLLEKYMAKSPAKLKQEYRAKIKANMSDPVGLRIGFWTHVDRVLDEKIDYNDWELDGKTFVRDSGTAIKLATKQHGIVDFTDPILIREVRSRISGVYHKFIKGVPVLKNGKMVVDSTRPKKK